MCYLYYYYFIIIVIIIFFIIIIIINSKSISLSIGRYYCIIFLMPVQHFVPHSLSLLL